MRATVALLDAVRHVDRAKESIVQDKVATPAEAPKDTRLWEESSRPHHIVAERSTKGQTNIHDNYKSVFSRYGEIQMQTGTEFIDQHNPQYLGMAFPFTQPCAVGGQPQNQRRDCEPRDLHRQHTGQEQT